MDASSRSYQEQETRGKVLLACAHRLFDAFTQWILIKNGSTWTIQSAFDNAGLIYIKTSDTYHGHGYAYPGGDSIDFKITEYNRQYSKLAVARSL
jgi:hypothetical protein